jgi:putative transposase
MVAAVNINELLEKYRTLLNIRISMDGRGRWIDNVFIERPWKSVKYEDVHLKAYSSIAEARQELTKYFDRYNQRRCHQRLDNMTPDEVYWGTMPKLKEAIRTKAAQHL